MYRGIGGSLLGTLIGVVTLHSTLETSDLGLVLDCNRYSIAASSGCSVVVVVIVVVVVTVFTGGDREVDGRTGAHLLAGLRVRADDLIALHPV